MLGLVIHALAPLAPTADAAASADAAALFDHQRMLAVGRNLFWTGLPVTLTGLIVHALWFLAGDEAKPRA